MPPNVCGLFYKLVVNFLAASDGFRMIARFSLSLSLDRRRRALVDGSWWSVLTRVFMEPVLVCCSVAPPESDGLGLDRK